MGGPLCRFHRPCCQHNSSVHHTASRQYCPRHCVWPARPIVVLTVVGLTRGLQAGLDALVTHEAAVWISYFILAAVFGLLGAILMRRRYTEEDK